MASNSISVSVNLNAALDTEESNYPRSVIGKSWIEAKEADLVRDAAKSLDAEASPGG